MKNFSFILSLLIMITMVSCDNGKKPTPGPDEPQVTHTITLDFEKAIPYHTEVSAEVTLHQWDVDTKSFVDSLITFDLTESNYRFNITSNAKSSLDRCQVSYINLSNEAQSYQAKFGSDAGDDKSVTTAFDKDKTYSWNDNAKYMVLQ